MEYYRSSCMYDISPSDNYFKDTVKEQLFKSENSINLFCIF